MSGHNKTHADRHRKGDDRAGHERRHTKRRHKGTHSRSRHDKHSPAGGGNAKGSERPSGPNNVLNLALVLLIPGALGAIGGRALRAKALSTAS